MRFLNTLFFSLCFCLTLRAADPDVLIFPNGEKLLGHFVRSTGSSVTFHSDTLGDINVDWSKIKELHCSHPFVVLNKSETAVSELAHGSISLADQKLVVTPASGAAQTIPIKDAAAIIDEPAYQAAQHDPGFFDKWTGAITAGASLVDATQNSSTYTAAVHLTRAIPVENWLDARNRTTVNFLASYGKVTQADTPTLKTEIFHVDAERDQFFTTRVYAFGQTAFDHNFSQGLDLQQSYGGGIGWTVIQQANQGLDLKTSINYLSQGFQNSMLNQNLIGSIFAETYHRKLPHGIQLTEQISVTPTWNNLRDYSAAGSAGMTMPVYKRLGITLATADTFLNDTQPGFKKNSFQFTTGITYSLK